MSSLLRPASLRLAVLPQRALATSAARKAQVTLDEETKARIYPRIGNRDVVGYGWNGSGSYMDRPEFPFPGIRFKENTSDIVALRAKEQGDWKNLTTEDIKTCKNLITESSSCSQLPPETICTGASLTSLI